MSADSVLVSRNFQTVKLSLIVTTVQLQTRVQQSINTHGELALAMTFGLSGEVASIYKLSLIVQRSSLCALKH